MSEIVPHIRGLKGPILITGASGFVGANLFKMLSAHRDDVYAVVQREKGWRLADERDERILTADLNDHVQVKNLVEAVNPLTIFDCVAYGAYSFEENPLLIHQTNYQSIVSLVSVLLKRNIVAYVHAGSSSEYGSNCTAPAEDAVCMPNSDYSMSKMAASAYLRFVGQSRQFPCVNLRLYSVYGPLEETSRLIPNLLRYAVQGKLPPFVDARTSRDFVYVDDVCTAFIIAATKMNPSLYGHAFNIGSGVKTTLGDRRRTRDKI